MAICLGPKTSFDRLVGRRASVHGSHKQPLAVENLLNGFKRFVGLPGCLVLDIDRILAEVEDEHVIIHASALALGEIYDFVLDANKKW
jgi:hypothetical protein